jgi:2-dehydro-3-deoxy-D-arabinonate dehydratase
MKLYRAKEGTFLELTDRWLRLEESIDSLLTRENLRSHLESLAVPKASVAPPVLEHECLAPILSQEVWAAGVTYYRSRDARMEEAETAAGGDFYDRVYTAERPELFYKSPGSRTVGPGGRVRIRRDAEWNVPEPELTLVISSHGKIVGYTIGNDMSSRDIEGENPLYLPQAKVYDGSCAVGPCILVPKEPLPTETEIQMSIHRGGTTVFEDSITLAALKRSPEELVEYLYRETTYPCGCLLMTGTGIVPPSSFTLETNDEIRISIAAIGSLVNLVQ